MAWKQAQDRAGVILANLSCDIFSRETVASAVARDRYRAKAELQKQQIFLGTAKRAGGEVGGGMGRRRKMQSVPLWP